MEAIRSVFEEDDATMDLLLTTGFQKPVCALEVEDRSSIRSALVDYHCLIRVKAEMDQFRDGLTDVGITDFLKQYSDITRPLLTSTSHGQIDAGIVTIPCLN